MLPSILAGQLQQGLADYIRTTFPMTNPSFKGSLDKLLETKDSVFHEPYINVRLPFRISEEDSDIFQAIHPKYKPYVHQKRAFERLTGEEGRSTLIATGTGSGKTECFLYPILEYCYKHRGETGIKALIIYPMNALASDQAKRIAELIYNSPELRGNVTAGMYVGGHEKNPCRVMSEEQIITDHETMLSSPPDIILTNYKMLDYLLIRPRDAALWQENKPETLKYISVDELHTFDGAQGTDLACLIRRLKDRLNTPPEYLCCIGTSATMGTGESAENIRNYASTIFGELFDQESVITEDRLTAGEFFDGYEVIDFTIPNNEIVKDLIICIEKEDQIEYLMLATKTWFDGTFVIEDIMSDSSRINIGNRLMVHNFARSLIELISGSYVQTNQIHESLVSIFPAITSLNNTPAILDSLFALISHARVSKNNLILPFLNVQVQLWMRELRRLLAKVSFDNITYALASDLNEQQSKQYLPVVNCRDCGETGWVSIANERGNLTLNDMNTFYNLYFKQDKKICMIFPYKANKAFGDILEASVCPNCLQLHIGDNASQKCDSCGDDTVSVIFPSNIVINNASKSKQYVCPSCGSKNGLSIIGLRSATAISASISQMFASKFNDDKKTLAFSDNVQDAAHRAGFFNSRTWKFGIRSAIQRFAIAEGNGLSLSEFSYRFIEYWHDRLSNEEFVSFFIAPNMTWMRAFEKMKSENTLGSDKEAKKLVTDIEYRIRYEIMLEYGMYSKIGRTLEKSGSSTIGFDKNVIDNVAKNVKERSINELGVLTTTDNVEFSRMVLGFLNIMKGYGAFNDPIFVIYTTNDGKHYLISNGQEKWLPGLQPGRNTPRFIYCPLEQSKKLYSFDLVSSSKYIDWIKSCVDEYIVGDDLYEDISNLILEELVKSEIVVKMPSSSRYNVWGIDKSKIKVSTHVIQFKCNTCGNMISVIEDNKQEWQGAPCVLSNCAGYLQYNDDSSLEYYNKLYSSGDLVRVIAKEHTGLLERDDREALEKSFKRGNLVKMPWDPNLLSCTPTLEMGIDIGDLSTIVLCNIPPAQAQFLQRAGRAGRKDGNSLSIVVANARPHDLFFYSDPMEMLSGVVNPPKIFLRASAVLERQFVAFSMDCWIKKGVSENAIPKHVGVSLSKLISRPSDIFPFNFLLFVQNNLSGLLVSFIKMFSQNLDEDSISDLKAFAQGDGLKESPMHMKIYEAFESLKKQRDALSDSIRQLKILISEIESKPKDSSYEAEIKELKSERLALISVMRNLNNKDIFNFLSDEGLLPNYAFPEAGIILKAILYRKEVGNDGDDNENKKHKYEKMVYEYNRSSSSAISEFAPSNNFYVDGRKLTIDQVDLTTAQVAKWRLCPNCSHAQIEETGKDVASCPRCGSPAWSDSGQVRMMLKVQMVYSNMDYTKSLIGDESEDRTSTFYCKQMLVDVNEDEDISKAYRMDNDEFAFGYEFVKKATLREINFGESDIVGERMTVSGAENIRKGFKICKYCGKIQPENGKAEHTYTCKAKNANPLSGDSSEEYLFLYREFVTEALRILIPATTMDSSNIRQESFTAAFMLGMKEYFGNVEHLRACLSEVPVIDADYRKQYLVIYDSVPGGTGYLKQLMQRKNSLVEVLEKALNVLENCTCKNDPQKDGCYHCLFAYRQSQSIGQISRITAIRLLNIILSGKNNVEEIPKLGNIPVNSLFESELERRFIKAIEQMKNSQRELKISKELIRNKEGYLLKIGDCLWEIEPQVLLDSKYGVPVKSRADFVLRPVRNSDGQKPIVIFTDGFLYHKDKVADDTLKREAIRRSKKFRLWSFTWKDIQNVFQSQGDYATATLVPGNMPSGSRVYRPAIESGNSQTLNPEKDSAFESFIKYLENKEAEKIFNVHAQAYAMSLLDTRNINNGIAFADWKNIVDPIIDIFDMNDSNFVISDTIFGKWIPRNTNSHLTILSGVYTSSMQKNGVNSNVSVFAILNDVKDIRTEKYEAEWNGFWQFFNIMQFNKSFIAVSQIGMNNLDYNAIPIINQNDTEQFAELNLVNEQWKEILTQVFDDIAKECANKLISLGVPAPSAVGYELVDLSGTVVAESEFAWEKEKVALLLVEQVNNREAFEKNGWSIITPDDNFSIELFNGGHTK